MIVGIFLYWGASILIIIGAWMNAGTSPGLSAAATRFLSFFAGAGLRGSLYYTWKHILAGLAAATVFMAFAHWLGRGFSAIIFGNVLTGTEWGWLGFVVCLLCTPKSFAENATHDHYFPTTPPTSARRASTKTLAPSRF